MRVHLIQSQLTSFGGNFTWVLARYPEFSKPLGAPAGRAVRNGYVWTSEFDHASVYVDARSRAASKITWH